MNYIFPETEKSWEAEGLKLDLVEPMKKWNISYEGQMINKDTKKAHEVNLEVSLFVYYIFHPVFS